MLRTFGILDPTLPKPLLEVPLGGPRLTDNDRVRFSDVVISDTDAVVVGWLDDPDAYTGGVMFDVDLSMASDSTVDGLNMEETVFFGVGVNDARVVVVGGNDGTGYSLDTRDLIEEGFGHVLGSEVMVWDRSAARSSGAEPAGPTGRRSGPGTFATLLAVNERHMFVLDYDSYWYSPPLVDPRPPSLGASSEARLWAIDPSGVFPSSGQPTELDGLDEYAILHAATENGLFLATFDVTTVFDVRGDEPVRTGDLPGSTTYPVPGSLAADGSLLAIATDDSHILLYEVADPTAPELLSRVDLPERHPDYGYQEVALSEGWLWWTANDTDGNSIVVLFDVRDPRRPSSGVTLTVADEDGDGSGLYSLMAQGRNAYATLANDEPSPKFTWLRVSDEDVPELVALEHLDDADESFRNPFWFAADDDRLWLWHSSIGDPRTPRLTIAEVSIHDPTEIQLLDRRPIPAGIRARMPHTTPVQGNLGYASFQTSNGFVFGARFVGGVFGFRR